MKTAIVLVTVDQEYDLNNFNIEDYVTWCIRNKKEYIYSVARNKEEAAILSQVMDNPDRIVVAEGTVNDQFDEWTYSEEDIKEIVRELKARKTKNFLYENWGIVGYLWQIGGKERLVFDTAQEAYDYGNKIRDDVAGEVYEDFVNVQISNNVVRLSLNKMEFTPV